MGLQSEFWSIGRKCFLILKVGKTLVLSRSGKSKIVLICGGLRNGLPLATVKI